VERFQVRSRQGVQAEDQSSILFYFFGAHDKTLAGTPRQKRDSSVDAKDFQDLFCLFKESWSDENEAQVDVACAEAGAKTLRPLLERRFLKRT
jgi:hypothetical protein